MLFNVRCRELLSCFSWCFGRCALGWFLNSTLSSKAHSLQWQNRLHRKIRKRCKCDFTCIFIIGPWKGGPKTLPHYEEIMKWKKTKMCESPKSLFVGLKLSEKWLEKCKMQTHKWKLRTKLTNLFSSHYHTTRCRVGPPFRALIMKHRIQWFFCRRLNSRPLRIFTRHFDNGKHYLVFEFLRCEYWQKYLQTSRKKFVLRRKSLKKKRNQKWRQWARKSLKY